MGGKKKHNTTASEHFKISLCGFPIPTPRRIQFKIRLGLLRDGDFYLLPWPTIILKWNCRALLFFSVFFSIIIFRCLRWQLLPRRLHCTVMHRSVGRYSRQDWTFYITASLQTDSWISTETSGSALIKLRRAGTEGLHPRAALSKQHSDAKILPEFLSSYAIH